MHVTVYVPGHAGFTEPGATYRVDMAAEQPVPELFRQTALKVPHDPADYETTQVC